MRYGGGSIAAWLPPRNGGIEKSCAILPQRGRGLAERSGQRQQNFHFEATTVGVRRMDAAALALDCALGDGQPESAAAALALARNVGAEVRFEDAGAIARGDAGSAVADTNACLAFDTIEADADRLAGSGVLDCIAYDIFNRAGDQISFGAHYERLVLGDVQRARTRLCLERGIAGDVSDQLVERDVFDL